jgi:hypothetical protein
VNLAAYPAVAHRQSVNTRLLAGLCGHGATGTSFTADDASMLLKIAGERFDPEHALLRRRALTGLAQTRTVDALETLSRIALSPIDNESARAAALAAVAQAAASFGTGLAMLLRDDEAVLVRTRARKSVAAAVGGAKSVGRRRARPATPARDR